MSPDAEDASPSPEPGIDLDDSGIMADEKVNLLERASTEEKSPSAQPTTNPNAGNNGQPAKSNSKDPSRPRRKKARRACFACQRAHLTCGDERPCLRCIKRGLQDQCHDGVRKKAKYLHDAPAEALMPGFAQNYAMNGNQSIPNVPGAATAGPNGLPVSQPGAFYPQNVNGGFPQYTPTTQGQMGPPMMESNGMVPEYNATQTVGTPTQFQSTASQQVSPAQEPSNAMDHTPVMSTAGNPPSFDTPYFDPNDTSMFNFNISDLNFGNHYGALEFGMLGHMSSGAVNTPDINQMNIRDSNRGSLSYDNSGNFTGGFNSYGQSVQGWQTVPHMASRHSSSNNIWASQNTGLDAYAIGEQASSLTGASPHSQNQDQPGFQSAETSPETQFAQPELLHNSGQRKGAFPGDPNTEANLRRRRNASEIYSSVTTPYPYTQGFHALTAFLQKRYPSKKVLRIAKALAAIRPSFISCNQNLTQDDLVFTEKCFQRTLCEYESFINHYGTPTIILRRTGEIATVSKEFCLVTGWRRDILLGREPNLNVNTGSNTSGTQTGASSRGVATPRIPPLEADRGRPQPVFLAEIMDEDSVVQFYEDFAELAFGASHTTIPCAPCELLKYRTKDDPGWGDDQLGDDGKRSQQQGDVKSDPLIKGEAGLGERDGRVKCQMCWTVKRDVFDMPMLIVMNFLPLI